jgi:hypothetical protein
MKKQTWHRITSKKEQGGLSADTLIKPDGGSFPKRVCEGLFANWRKRRGFVFAGAPRAGRRSLRTSRGGVMVHLDKRNRRRQEGNDEGLDFYFA